MGMKINRPIIVQKKRGVLNDASFMQTKNPKNTKRSDTTIHTKNRGGNR